MSSVRNTIYLFPLFLVSQLDLALSAVHDISVAESPSQGLYHHKT